MSKVVTLRLSEEEYKRISAAAKIENRPISNFITTIVIKEIEESYYVDPIEMAQIKSDKNLIGKLKIGHRDAKEMKGRFIE
jgi:predicted DNA-binding protein